MINSIATITNFIGTLLLTKFCLNDIPHTMGVVNNPKPKPKWVPPEEKFRLIKRTKRGSLILVRREGDEAKLEITNMEDMNDISRLLNASGIKWKMERGVRKDVWERTPVHLRSPRGVYQKDYPGYTITFNFSDLERIMEGRILQPLMLED